MRTYDDPFEAALAEAVRREIEAIARSVVADTAQEIKTRKDEKWEHLKNSESQEKKS